MKSRLSKLIMLMLVMTSARSMSRSTQLGFPNPKITQTILPNGLKVVHLASHRMPVVTVQVWYHVGSKDDPESRRGSAHMFEHMMFKGSKHVRGQEHAQMLERIGGRNEAFTTEDVTAFIATVPKQYMNFAMQLEAERMQHLLITKKTIDTEREVIKEEIQMYLNNPISKAFIRFREMAFFGHPYAFFVGGYIEDLQKTTSEDFRSFYRRFYQPNNAILVVVGDVTAAQVVKVAQKWFGSIPRGKPVVRPTITYRDLPPTKHKREVVEASQVGVVMGGYRTPRADHPDQIPLRVLSSILSNGDSSRLYQRIVRKDRMGVAAGVHLGQMEDMGLMLFYGVYLAPDHGPRIEAALLDEIDRLRQEPVSQADLEKAKNQIAFEFIASLQEVSGLAKRVGITAIMTGDARAWFDDYQRILTVESRDLLRVAKKYLTRDNLTLVVVPPGAGSNLKDGP